MSDLQGRRRPDQLRGDLPEDIKAGDYWRVLRASGEPVRIECATNLTESMWMVVAPLPVAGSEEAYGIGNLMHHTVREHDDGTISVLPGDGSSNSILITRRDRSWHGYIYRGIWRSC